MPLGKTAELQKSTHLRFAWADRLLRRVRNHLAPRRCGPVSSEDHASLTSRAGAGDEFSAASGTLQGKWMR